MGFVGKAVQGTENPAQAGKGGKMNNKKKRGCIMHLAEILFFVGMFLLILSPVYGEERNERSTNAPFNVSEVIEKVTHHPIREGERIVIKGMVYEAYFDEDGVVLKPREGKENAEDLRIPIRGRPEIRDGKVIYLTEKGEVIFEGRRSGLRFEERNFFWDAPIIEGYTGNVANLKMSEGGKDGEFLIDTNVVYVPAPSSQYYPSVSFDGTNYLVVWEDYRSGSSYDIYGARVSQSGTVLDPSGIPISTATNDQWYPSVSFDGTNYLVVWQDDRSGSYDIYGARVNPSGVVIDSFPVSEQPGNQFSPALAHGSGNKLLITYSGWVDYINGYPANTMRIWGKFYEQTGIQEGEIGEARLEVYPNPFRNVLNIKLQFSNQSAINSKSSYSENLRC